MLCLVHIQLRPPFLVCGRLLSFKQTKTPCLAVFDISREYFFYSYEAMGACCILGFNVETEVFTQDKRKDR